MMWIWEMMVAVGPSKGMRVRSQCYDTSQKKSEEFESGVVLEVDHERRKVEIKFDPLPGQGKYYKAQEVPFDFVKPDTANLAALKEAGQGIFALKTLTPALQAICGAKTLPCMEVTQKVWAHIQKNGLNEGHIVKTDEKLRALLSPENHYVTYLVGNCVNVTSSMPDPTRDLDEELSLRTLAEYISKHLS